MKITNAVKDAAASGRRVRGIHMTFAAPAVIEVLAAVELDFVYIDGEHGCFDWRDIEAACLAAERHQLTPIARIPDAIAATITRFLDRGVSGIVAPHIESLDAARQCHREHVLCPDGSAIVRRGTTRIWPAHREQTGLHAGVQCGDFRSV